MLKCFGSNDSHSPCFPAFPGIHKLEKGSIALGMVTSVQPQVGLVVKLPFGGAGAVSVTDVADTYRSKPLEAFRKDQLVRLVDDEVQRSSMGSSKKK